MFGSICPSQTQPWAGASQSTVGTWVCCLGSSSSSDLARVACREAALALPAPGIAVPPAEPTYLQVLEGKTTFPTLLSPVLAAYLIEYAKAVQTRSLQHVHCLEQLQDGKVRGGSGERKWVPVTRRMDMQQCQWGCSSLHAAERAAGCPGGEAGWDHKEWPSIWLDHVVPKISLSWSSWMLSPSLGLGG